MRIVLECLKTGKGKRKKEYYTAVELKPSADHDIGVDAKLNLKLEGLFAGKDYEVGRLYEFHLMPLYGTSKELSDPHFVMTRMALRFAAEQIMQANPDQLNDKGKPVTVEDIERELLDKVRKMPVLPQVNGLFLDMGDEEEGPASEGDQTLELEEATGDRVVSTAGEVLAQLKPEGEDEASDKLRALAQQYSEREEQKGEDVIFVVPDHYVSYFRPGSAKPSGPSLFGAIERAAAEADAKGASVTLRSPQADITITPAKIADAPGRATKAAGEKAKAPAKSKAPAKAADKKGK